MGIRCNKQAIQSVVCVWMLLLRQYENDHSERFPTQIPQLVYCIYTSRPSCLIYTVHAGILAANKMQLRINSHR